MIETALSRFAGQIDAVAPIPLSQRRQRKRGYNQASLLAEPIAAAIAVPLLTGVLLRHSQGRSQARRNRRERRLLGRATFEVRGSPPGRVLLIDDVRTTGTTLKMATAALVRQEVSSVRTLSLAGPTEEPSRV
jgi:ComF family protein